MSPAENDTREAAAAAGPATGNSVSRRPGGRRTWPLPGRVRGAASGPARPAPAEPCPWETPGPAEHARLAWASHRNVHGAPEQAPLGHGCLGVGRFGFSSFLPGKRFMAGKGWQWKWHHLSVPWTFFRVEAAAGPLCSPPLPSQWPRECPGHSARASSPGHAETLRTARLSALLHRRAGQQLHKARLGASRENRHWGF